MFNIIALAAFLPLVAGHGAIFGDHVFGSKSGGISANPLTKSQSLNQWFFRGLKPSSAKSSIDITPGGSVTMNVACSQDNADRGIMCNDGGGSLHLNNGKGSGCALLISYKSFESIQPNDMTVFSVLHDCPNMNSKRVFKVPSNLPAGEATCAFHWVPPEESSADEQYMNGFKCNIKGSNGGTLASSNQKPLYWAAQGVSLPDRRPQYVRISDGAQKLTVNGGSSSSATSTSDSSGSSSGTATSKTPTNPKKGGNRGSSSSGAKKCSKRSLERKRMLRQRRRELEEATKEVVRMERRQRMMMMKSRRA